MLSARLRLTRRQRFVALHLITGALLPVLPAILKELKDISKHSSRSVKPPSPCSSLLTRYSSA